MFIQHLIKQDHYNLSTTSKSGSDHRMAACLWSIGFEAEFEVLDGPLVSMLDCFREVEGSNLRQGRNLVLDFCPTWAQ